MASAECVTDRPPSRKYSTVKEFTHPDRRDAHAMIDLIRHGVRESRRPPSPHQGPRYQPRAVTRTKAAVAEGARAWIVELFASEGAHEGAAPQHRLRGGALPEHR